MGVEITGRLAKPFSRWTADTEQAFLLALRLSGQVTKAAAEIGRSASTAYKWRRRNPAFAAAWDETLAAQQAEWIAAQREWLGPEDDEAGGGRLTPGQQRRDGWNARTRTVFLESLRRTKDVRAACAAAGMSSTSAYNLRGRSPGFSKAWAKALEGEIVSVLDAARSRAVEGWDEPIVHNGQIIGTRKRYSDGLLRDLLRQERDGTGGSGSANGRATEAELTEAIMKNLALLEARLKRKKAAAHEAEWGRARRTWGNWGRISAGEMEAEPPPPDPDAMLDDEADEEEEALEGWD